MAPFIAIEPNSVTGNEDKFPKNDPIGVLAAPTIKTFYWNEFKGPQKEFSLTVLFLTNFEPVNIDGGEGLSMILGMFMN